MDLPESPNNISLLLEVLSDERLKEALRDELTEDQPEEQSESDDEEPQSITSGLEQRVIRENNQELEDRVLEETDSETTESNPENQQTTVLEYESAQNQTGDGVINQPYNENTQEIQDLHSIGRIEYQNDTTM